MGETGRSYNWTATGGTIISDPTQDNIDVIWNTTGMGQLILRETIDATGCSFADTMNITIQPLPTPVANGDTEVCELDTESYNVVTPSGNNYSWLVNNGTINGNSDASTVSITWGTTGVGQLILQETNPTTTCVNYDTLTININPNPNPTITGRTTICNADTITYRVTDAGNTFTWGVTNGVIIGDATLDTVRVAWTGTTSGQVFITETNPTTTCFGQDTLDILINPIPAPTITGNTDVCFGETVTYQIETSNIPNHTYTWTVTNGSVISGGTATDDQIEIRWDGVNPGLIHVVETITATGCFAENFLPVTINPLPTPTITGVDTLCPQDIENYSVPDAGTGNGYIWTVSGGTITSGAGTNSITVQWGDAGSGQIIIREFTPVLGCMGFDTLDVLINPLPTPIIAGSNRICQGLTDTYSVAMNADRTYFWTVSGGTITSGAGTNSIVVQWGTAGAGQVIVRETINSTGCFLDDTLAVTVDPEPTPTITGDNEVCLQSTHSYSVDNSGNTFLWTVTNGTIIGSDALSTVQINWIGPNPGQIIITETITATGCINRDTMNVIINPIPSPVITGVDEVCENQTEAYSVPPSPGSQFNWTVTNGTIMGDPTADNIQVVWSSSGQIIVRETIETTGCFLEDTLNVTVNTLPINSINGQDTVCIGDTENYNIVADPNNTYSWSVAPANGTITGVATADNIDVNWTTAGTAQVILREEVTVTGCVNLDTLDIVIIDQPNTDITGTTSLCAGDTATYQAALPPAGFTYLYTWTVQGGSVISGDGTSQVQVAWNNTPTGADYILVTIQVQGSSCSASTPLPGGPGDMGFVVLHPLPTPVINSTTGLGDVCQFATHQYNTTNNPANTYNWTVIGGNIIAGAGTSDITVEWQTVGVGALNLTQVVDSTGCTQSATEVSVNIIESPGLPTTEDRNLCIDGSANLYATEPTATQFNWYDVATGGTPLATTPSGTPFTTNILNTAGSPYTFYVSALNATNCEGQRTPIQVTVDPTINVQVSELSLTNVETCNNDTSGILEVVFINGDSPYTYDILLDGASFTNGNIPFGSDTLILRSLGVGTYTVNVTDDGGCTGTADFTIISDPKFISQEFISSDTLIAEGESLTLRAGALDAQLFEWTDSLGAVLGTDSTLTLTPAQSATYNVLITNDKGCDTTLSVRVDVVPLEIFVPNVFSPNGDNRNDRFQVFGTGIQSVQLRIFNRLGDLLYETDQWIEGTNLDDAIGWDGTFNNKIQQNGNYVWSLNGLFINNQPFKKTGNVLLMR